jgi:hypothetical protein
MTRTRQASRWLVLAAVLTAPPGAFAESPVTVTLRPKVVAAKGGRRVVVDVDIKNGGPRKVVIDPHGAFACGGWQPDISIVKSDETDVPYIGPEVVLSGPPKKEELAPGAKLSVRGLDVTDLYYFPKEAARLTLRFTVVVVDGDSASQVQSPQTQLDFRPVAAREPGSTVQAVGRTPAGAGSRTIRCEPPRDKATGKPVL